MPARFRFIMKEKYFEIGRIVSTHGLKGEVRLQCWADSPEFVKQFKRVYFFPDGRGETAVKSCRTQKHMSLLTLEGVDNVEEAQKLRGKILYIRRGDVKLEEGRYFIQDLIGCRCLDADDGSVCYGTIADVSQPGANDVWHVEKDGKEYLLPAIPEVVKSVDVEAGTVLISPMKGIFDDAD